MKPTLLLIHGAVLNGGMWGPIAADLEREFKVLTPDLPGHGAQSSEPFRLDAAVAMVRDLARSLAPEPVVLVGDSLGSYVSLATAPSLGEQLRGAVLGGCTFNFQGPMFLIISVQIALTRLMSPATLKNKLAQYITRDYKRAGPAILARGIRPESYAEGVAELRQVDFRAAIAAIQVPIVLINGSRDVPHRLGEKAMLARAQRVTLRLAEGVGHGVSLKRPDLFTRWTREFLATLPD